MEFHLLLPDEAATLLGTSSTVISEAISAGKLGAFREHGEWWIPLQCLAMYPGDEFNVEAACALSDLIRQGAAYVRSVASDPEAVARIEQGDFPPGSVGACLKQALRMYRRAQEGLVAGNP